MKPPKQPIRPARQMLELLDEFGVDWRRVYTLVRVEFDPRRHDDGWGVALVIEIPSGYIPPDKVAELQRRLERLDDGGLAAVATEPNG